VWGRTEIHAGFLWEDLMEIENLEKLEVDGNIILKLIFKKCYGGVHWIVVAQYRDRWRSAVNAVMIPSGTKRATWKT
jgi:hypothetical protein